jgi:Replication-relaxation
MRPPLHLTKGHVDILSVLALFDYLTARQVTRLLYASGSFTYVTTLLKALVESGLAVTIGGRGTSLPLIYTLTGKGRSLASSLSGQQRRRFRPAEAREKQTNTYFMRHLLSVNDVLIGARLLSETRPDIMLTRMYREPELRRRIYVALPERICIEPDASCQFLITVGEQEKRQTWEDFFHIEVYRNLPPVKEHYKQKIQGYVTYVDTGQHEMLFETPALSLAVIAQTGQMMALLKSWTEEALRERERIADGDWFFFCGLDPATASPEELFLSPVWEQAFSTTKTPLLLLE